MQSIFSLSVLSLQVEATLCFLPLLLFFFVDVDDHDVDDLHVVVFFCFVILIC